MIADEPTGAHRSDLLNAMAVDPDGSAIFATGESGGAGDVGILDVGTVAYRGYVDPANPTR